MGVPVTILHTPAEMVRKYLLGTAVVSEPSPVTNPVHPNWTVYAFKMRADKTSPNGVFVVNTTAVKDTRAMSDGLVTYHEGIQIMTRSLDQKAGWLKSRMIEKWLCENLKNTDVTLDGTIYRLHAFTVTSPTTFIGEEEKQERQLHTVNGILALTANP